MLCLAENFVNLLYNLKKYLDSRNLTFRKLGPKQGIENLSKVSKYNRDLTILNLQFKSGLVFS